LIILTFFENKKIGLRANKSAIAEKKLGAIHQREMNLK
jgi:hypothetical protein